MIFQKFWNSFEYPQLCPKPFPLLPERVWLAPFYHFENEAHATHPLMKRIDCPAQNQFLDQLSYQKLFDCKFHKKDRVRLEKRLVSI